MNSQQPHLPAEKQKYRLWVASGTAGIYAVEFSPQTRTFRNKHQSIDTSSLSVTYLAKHPVHPVLYAVLRGEGFGEIHAYSITVDGELNLINQIDDCPAGAAHCSVDPSGKFLVVAFYISGKAGIYPLDNSGNFRGINHEIAHTGSSLHPDRQTSPHPHWAGFSPKHSYLYVTDLGSDQIKIYQPCSSSGQLTCQQKVFVPPGSGPRHMAFHPHLDIVYVTNELQPGVARYHCAPETGTLKAGEVIDSLTGQHYPSEQKDSELCNVSDLCNASDLKIHPSGRFLYVLNRGVAVITTFSIHQETGTLKLIARIPAYTASCRNITFTPDGEWMFVTGEFSHSLIIFRVNPDDGELTCLPLMIAVPNAMLVVIDQV